MFSILFCSAFALISKAQNTAVPKTTNSSTVVFYKANLPLRDSIKYNFKPLPVELTDSLINNDGKMAKEKDSFLVDHFSTSKLQKNPDLEYIKRNLLFKDTDKRAKLIY